MKTTLLILFRETIAVYFDNHAKPVNKISEKKFRLLNVKAAGTYYNHALMADLLNGSRHELSICRLFYYATKTVKLQ
jgi:hypothetical protein